MSSQRFFQEECRKVRQRRQLIRSSRGWSDTDVSISPVHEFSRKLTSEMGK
jgi:hypothetical protein